MLSSILLSLVMSSAAPVESMDIQPVERTSRRGVRIDLESDKVSRRGVRINLESDKVSRRGVRINLESDKVSRRGVRI